MRNASCVAALATLLTVSNAFGALVTGPWDVATTNPPGGQGNGPITNGNTASPTVGDGTSNSAAGEMIDSAFAPVTLGAAGEHVYLTGYVNLIGTVASASSSATPRTQFRFGLFDGDDAGLDDNGWVGYYMSNKHGDPGTPAGVLARKSVGNTTIYLSATGQTVLASQQGDGTVSSQFLSSLYRVELKIERNASGHLSLNGSLTGANGFSQLMSITDTNAAANGTYTFDHVGFLLGANLGADQGDFTNIDVTYYVPEPATAGLFAVGALGLLARRRRA